MKIIVFLLYLLDIFYIKYLLVGLDFSIIFLKCLFLENSYLKGKYVDCCRVVLMVSIFFVL